ncbi:MAG: GGDEF domain-containing protein [Chloroflexota bacterium]
MSPELIFFIVTVVVANVLVIGVLVALPRGQRGEEAGTDVALPTHQPPELRTKYAESGAVPTVHELNAGGGADYRRILRILWWLVIAAALIGVGLSGAFRQNEQLIFGLGIVAVAAAIVFHEVIPSGWRANTVGLVEAFVALALAAALLVLTGYGSSPFVFGFDVAVVAVALARGGRGAFVFAAIASLAYVGVLAIDPARSTYVAGDLLGFGLHIGAIWLLTLIASVFAGQERRIRARMLQMSVTDPLTGLFNRSHIYTTVDNEIRRTRRSDRGFCLLMIDLDGLKVVNDSFGHHRGDTVLRALGGVILRSIRTVDSAYRYGGDEFLILLPETDIVGAFVVAEKIRSSAEEIGEGFGGDATTSVSIGLVSHPEDGGTVEELMIAADRAMYAAKGLGKNQISGNPRPRRSLATSALPVAVPASIPVGEPAPPIAAEAPPPEAAAAAPETASVIITPPPAPTAVAAPETASVIITPPPAPTAVAEPEVPEAAPDMSADLETDDEFEEELEPAELRPNGTHPATTSGDEDLDPAEARRRIAALSYDPDYQIRRAMDAFLGAPGPRRERRDRDRDDDQRAS